MTTFKFNGHEVNFDELPQSSKDALLSRVAGHFNNESASAAIGWARKMVAGDEGKAADVSAEEAKAYRDAHPDETSAFIKTWYATKLTQLQDGTLGVRAAGGGADPLEAAMHKIARAEIRTLLGKDCPSGKDEKATSYTGSDGTVYVGSAGHDAIAAKWLDFNDAGGSFGKAGEPNRPRIERLAKRELAAKADAAKKVVAPEARATLGF